MKRKIIYAEWTFEGKFDNGFFKNWEEYHKFFFNPCYEVTKVKVI